MEYKKKINFIRNILIKADINIFLNVIIIIFAIILLLFSLASFVIIQKELFSYSFRFDTVGLNNYIFSFTTYKELYAATMTLIVSYFAILRLKAAEVANLEKVKQDRFSEWKIQLEIRILEVEKNNPYLKRQLTTIRYKFFNKLYEIKMSINSKEDIIKIFDDDFKKSLLFLEENNLNYKSQGGIYLNKKATFFYNDFFFVFCGSLDNFYDDLYKDLKEVYLTILKPDRIISEFSLNK